MKKIKSITLSRLHQEESFGFHKLVYAEINSLQHEKLSDLLYKYGTALTDFDEALKQSRASVVTREITQLDEKRDKAYRGLAAQVRNSLTHFEEAKTEAAYKINLVLKNYGDPTDLPYIEENGVLENLIQDLEKPEITTCLETIGAKEWVSYLKEINSKFILSFSERNTEQSVKITGITKETRKAMDAAYATYVNRLNALVEVFEDANFTPVIEKVNKLVEYQKTVLAARKTTNAKVGEKVNNGVISSQELEERS